MATLGESGRPKLGKLTNKPAGNGRPGPLLQIYCLFLSEGAALGLGSDDIVVLD